MKCFNHPERDAVAICKSCNKALCHECLSEVPNGIACKGKCEEEAIFLNEMVQRSKNAYKRTAGTYYRSSLTYLIMAVVFVGFGFTTELPTLKPFMFVMGGVMALTCLLTAFSANKYKK